MSRQAQFASRYDGPQSEGTFINADEDGIIPPTPPRHGRARTFREVGPLSSWRCGHGAGPGDWQSPGGAPRSGGARGQGVELAEGPRVSAIIRAVVKTSEVAVRIEGVSQLDESLGESVRDETDPWSPLSFTQVHTAPGNGTAPSVCVCVCVCVCALVPLCACAGVHHCQPFKKCYNQTTFMACNCFSVCMRKTVPLTLCAVCVCVCVPSKWVCAPACVCVCVCFHVFCFTDEVLFKKKKTSHLAIPSGA